MSRVGNAIAELVRIDDWAGADSPVHRLHPLSKVLVTLVFLILVASCGKYEVSRLFAFVFYPVVITTIARVPSLPLLKRVLWTLPLVLLVGIFNPLLDTTCIMRPAGFPVTGGMLSLLSLTGKALLMVTGALLLVATTGLNPIARALRMLRVPRIFITQLLLLFRYITMLMGEVSRVLTAHALRAPQQRGVSSRAWGSLLGQILLRTYDRALVIHQAMLLRGFNGNYPVATPPRFAARDALFVAGWTIFLLAARRFNFAELIGSHLLSGGA